MASKKSTGSLNFCAYFSRNAVIFGSGLPFTQATTMPIQSVSSPCMSCRVEVELLPEGLHEHVERARAVLVVDVLDGNPLLAQVFHDEANGAAGGQFVRRGQAEQPPV